MHVRHSTLRVLVPQRMPFGAKDLYETVDMPTQMNMPKYDGW